MPSAQRTTLYDQANSKALAELLRSVTVVFAVDLLQALSAREPGPVAQLTLMVAAILLVSPHGTDAPDIRAFAKHAGVTGVPALHDVVKGWNSWQGQNVDMQLVEKVYSSVFADRPSAVQLTLASPGSGSSASTTQTDGLTVQCASGGSEGAPSPKQEPSKNQNPVGVSNQDIADLTAKFEMLFSKVSSLESAQTQLNNKSVNLHERLEKIEQPPKKKR